MIERGTLVLRKRNLEGGLWSPNDLFITAKKTKEGSGLTPICPNCGGMSVDEAIKRHSVVVIANVFQMIADLQGQVNDLKGSKKKKPKKPSRKRKPANKHS